MPIQIRFQPTLFIFLGTSSGQIGWRLKKLLHDAYGDVPILRFLWIDIDNNVDPRARPYFASHERVELSGWNAASVVQNLSHYPTIQKWWPAKTNLKAGMLSGSGGAQKQMRLIGRLALFRKFNDQTRGRSLISRLSDATAAISSIDNHRATLAMSNETYTFTVNPGARVFLCFSPCGGTGSSMAFDIAYLCRHLLAGNEPKVISMSVLPPVIDLAIEDESASQKEKIRANAYAWFKEDLYLQENPVWTVEYPGVSVDVAAPPFNHRYMVDIQNQAGYRLNSPDDVYNMIAQAIFLDAGSAIGGNMQAFNENVGILEEVFEEKPRAYSSLAATSLVFPKERLKTYCSALLAKALLEKGFLGEPDGQEVNVNASSLLSQLKLRDADLIEKLKAAGNLSLTLEPSILKADTVALALSHLDAQEARSNDDRRSLGEKMKVSAAEMIPAAYAGLDREIARLAATRGLKFALGILERLAAPAPAGQVPVDVLSLAGLKARLVQQGESESDLENARLEYKRQRDGLKRLDDGPEDMIERAFNLRGWKKKSSAYKQDCLNKLRAVNDTAAQIAAQAQAAQFYDQIAAKVSEMKKSLTATIACAKKLAVTLEDEANNATSRARSQSLNYEFLQEVEVDFAAYYKKHSSKLDPATAFSTIAPEAARQAVAGLDQWVAEGLKKAALEYGETVFKPGLERVSLLEAIREMAELQGKDARQVIAAYINDLVAYCHPFWHFNADFGIQNIDARSILGVEDGSHPLIPEIYRGGETQYIINTTGVPDRIDVVRIFHGMPAFMLSGMKDYRQVYDSKRKGNDPLHVLPGMDQAADLFPEESQKNRDFFAIGIAFKYIVQIGNWYYFDLEQGYQEHKIQPGKEFRLAQGREKAEEAFSRKEDWVRQLEEAIDSYVRKNGNDKTVQDLKPVIEALLVKIANLGPNEDSLRKQYEKEVRALRAYQRSLEG